MLRASQKKCPFFTFIREVLGSITEVLGKK